MNTVANHEQEEALPDNIRNIAQEYGFDDAVLVWSHDTDVQKDLERLLGHAKQHPQLEFKTLSGLDLSAEEPFNLKTAHFEDIDMKDLKFPAGTDLSNAEFEGCNVYGVNFNECNTGE